MTGGGGAEGAEGARWAGIGVLDELETRKKFAWDGGGALW